MKIKSWLRISVISGCAVLALACSKNPNGLVGAGDGIASQGLGKFAHFIGQEAGESYTTQAPHDQLYLFAYDDATFNSKYIDSLNAQIQYLKSAPGARILLAGHTDERGSREYNIALGEHRANSISELLRMAGVNHNQYRVVSYGKERPINFGHDEASHRQNRRVELTYEVTR